MKTYAFNSDDEEAVLDYFNNLEGSIHLIATVVSWSIASWSSHLFNLIKI